MKIFKYPSTIQNFSCILPSRVTYRMFPLYCLQSHAAETETQPLNCSQSRSCCTFQKWKTLFNQITHTGYFWANWKYQSVQHKNMIKYELCGWVRVCVCVCQGVMEDRSRGDTLRIGVVVLYTLCSVCVAVFSGLNTLCSDDDSPCSRTAEIWRSRAFPSSRAYTNTRSEFTNFMECCGADI